MSTRDDRVCSLPAEEIPDRAATIRREILPHVRAREKLPRGLALEFDRDAELRAKLEAFVAFERRCCGGLAFELRDAPDADRLRLTIEGDGAEIFAFLGGEPTGG